MSNMQTSKKRNSKQNNHSKRLGESLTNPFSTPPPPPALTHTTHTSNNYNVCAQMEGNTSMPKASIQTQIQIDNLTLVDLVGQCYIKEITLSSNLTKEKKKGFYPLIQIRGGFYPIVKQMIAFNNKHGLKIVYIPY